jgi:hypothetical protein
MGEDQANVFEPSFNRSIKVQAKNQRITSNAGVMLLREVDEHLSVCSEIARNVRDPSLRNSEIDIFRQAVRQWAFKELKAEEKRERSEEERLEALKKNGILSRDDLVPDKPGPDCFFICRRFGAVSSRLQRLHCPQNHLNVREPAACLRDQVPSERERSENYTVFG